MATSFLIHAHRKRSTTLNAQFTLRMRRPDSSKQTGDLSVFLHRSGSLNRRSADGDATRGTSVAKR